MRRYAVTIADLARVALGLELFSFLLLAPQLVVAFLIFVSVEFAWALGATLITQGLQEGLSQVLWDMTATLPSPVRLALIPLIFIGVFAVPFVLLSVVLRRGAEGITNHTFSILNRLYGTPDATLRAARIGGTLFLISFAIQFLLTYAT
jgi:hypothetical protein